MPAPNRLDQVLVKKAAHAIIQKHNQDIASRPSLFDDEGNTLMVQLQLSRPFTRDSYKLVRVKVPHSIYGNNADIEYSICYFCVSNYKEDIESYLRDHPIQGLNRILSMKDVQKFYKSYNDMKKLLREFTHFVVDAAIVRQLYNFLGPVFGAKHRMPIQIHCTSPSQVAGEIDKILQSSYIHLGGDNISMKIGHTKHTAQQIAENVIMGVDFLAGKIPNSWSNILSIHLRLAQSVAIPVYSKKENELVEFLQSQVKKQQAQSSSSSVSSVEEKSVQKTFATAKSTAAAANVVVTPATAVTSSVKKSAKKDNPSAAKPVEVPVSATKSKKTSHSNDSQNKKEVSTKKQAKVGARPSGIPQAGGKKK